MAFDSMFAEGPGATDYNPTPSSDLTRGRALGPIDAFNTAYDQVAKTDSTLSIPKALSDAQDAINDRLEAAGEERIPKLPFMSDLPGFDRTTSGAFGLLSYNDAARFLSGKGTPEEQANGEAMVADYDQRVMKLREKRPDLNIPTVAEQFKQIQDAAAEAERRYDAVRFSLVGGVGGLAGQMAAGMNPGLNPLNTLTAGLSGVGKSAAMRIATAGGANAAVEAVDQLTGVDEQRKMLGLQTDGGRVASSIISAGLGGAALQGVGEAGKFLFKKWFPNTVDDPSPPPPLDPLRPGEEPPKGADPDLAAQAVAVRDVEALLNDRPDIGSGMMEPSPVYNPLSESRMGRARVEADIQSTMERLQRWDLSAEELTSPEPAYNADALKALYGSSIDDAARAADPEAFRLYDGLRAELDEVRSKIEASPKTPEDQIPDLPEIIGKKNKRMREIEARRNEIVSGATNTAELRDYAVFLDQKIRDTAPLIGRAYARAVNEWEPSKEIAKAVQQMVETKADELPGAPPQKKLAPGLNKVEGVNEARIAAAGGRSEGETSADTLTRINAKELGAEEQNVEKRIADLPKQLDPKAPEEMTLPKGVTLDTILTTTDENGNTVRRSLRDLLGDVADDDTELKAVSACSINGS